MSLCACLMGLLACFAEPVADAEETSVSPIRVVDDELPSPLTIPEELLNLIPSDLARTVDEAKSELKRLDETRSSEYHARQAKQVMVHLTPERTRVYPPNRRSQGVDIWDDVLPPGELFVLCDEIEQTTLDGQDRWHFQGNVRVFSSRFVIHNCHETTVVRTEKHIKLTVSGGKDVSMDDAGDLKWNDLQPTQSTGSSMLAGRGAETADRQFAGGCLFSSGTIWILPNDGQFLVKMGSTVPNSPRE